MGNLAGSDSEGKLQPGRLEGDAGTAGQQRAGVVALVEQGELALERRREHPDDVALDAFQRDQQLPDHGGFQAVRLVDDYGGAGLGSDTVAAQATLDFLDALVGQPAGVVLLDVQVVGYLGGNQPGQRRLAGPALAGDPEGAAGQTAAAQHGDLLDRLVLAHDLIEGRGPVLLK